MLSSVIRKINQIQSDPVLRQWLWGRALGRWPGEPSYTPHRPPYLDGLLPLEKENPTGFFRSLPSHTPENNIVIELAGQKIEIAPGEEEALFQTSYEDIETLLSVHRFAWMTTGRPIDPAWVQAIWQAWRKSFGEPSGNWAWHPYTASERASNILNFARRYGLPGSLQDTMNVLAGHARAIAARLEYFGDHHTSNHLANNGHGLYGIGVTLGMENATEMGLKILLNEAQRIFRPSGILREGSSHYQLLLLRLYENAAGLAADHHRSEARELRGIAERLRKAASALMLPGGLPLIGDISPDIPPDTLLAALDLKAGRVSENLIDDGWLRFDDGLWSGLWHASPEGFSHMPGHGHQDMGSFELHYRNEPVFIDPGRGTYGEEGDAALYRSADVHNGLTINGKDPYPPNRPYYSETFRRHVVGHQPRLKRSENGVSLLHHPFSRIIPGISHFRKWTFESHTMSLVDALTGAGRCEVTRRLVTPLNVEMTQGGVLLTGRTRQYRITCEGAKILLIPVTRWRAYAQGEPAHMIEISGMEKLPYEGILKVEIL